MRFSVLAPLSIALAVPCTVFAAQSGAPCDLLDREAYVALKLDSATQSVENKVVEGEKNAPKQEVKTCHVDSTDPAVLSFMLTSVKAPPNVNYGKASCSVQPVQKLAMSMCSATIKNQFVTVVMMSKQASAAATKAALASQVERLSK